MSPAARAPAFDFTLLKSARVPRGFHDAKDLEGLAAFVLANEGVSAPVFLTLDLTHTKRIQQLNRHFRGIDRTTDVIAFRDDLPVDVPARNKIESRRYWTVTLPVKGQALQGDIAINIEQAALQAKKEGHPVSREIRLLLIHGILHLLGYTDYDPVPKRIMFKRQGALLRRWESRKRL
jgi:probable rRNA maturation factor